MIKLTTKKFIILGKTHIKKWYFLVVEPLSLDTPPPLYLSNDNSVTFSDTELSQKTRFQSIPIAVLCLYDIQRENLVFKKFSLCLAKVFHDLFLLIDIYILHAILFLFFFLYFMRFWSIF